MKYFIALVSIVAASLAAKAQSTDGKPRLVVGIVVDQMRNDYLQRYEDLYGSGGFKRMMNDGFYCANHHFSYVPTSTGPGHASVYTGTTPSVHGIVANNWYDPRTREDMYCAQDKSVKTVGADNADGQMSPVNLQTTTITDELRLFWNFKSKVIGISIKDRGAILPVGRTGTAYWYSKGSFISSSWYMNELPQWVVNFNKQNYPGKYIKTGWSLLLEPERYSASLPDDSPYEKKFAGEEKPVFPKNLKKLTEENGPDFVIKSTPYGNTLVFDFAKAAINAEGLGKDAITDFLAISFSTPDYMGHAAGIRAVEIQDMYLRLDAELAEFFSYLDKEVGVGQYSVFLTADHGAAEVPNYALDNKLPAGYIDEKGMKVLLDSMLTEIHPLGGSLLDRVEESCLFFNKENLKESGLDYTELCENIARRVRNLDGIYNAYTGESVIWSGGSDEFPHKQLNRGIYPPVAPDVIWVHLSGYISYGPVGTTHGSPWRYDTHIPLLMYGNGIEKGSTYRETNIRDIAPTFSMLLGIPLPSGSTGQVVHEAISK
jgi:predicted AlkP superfamily pyrophosphatase or phosphodiesterase